MAQKIIWSHTASNELLSILQFYFERNGNTKYSEKLLSEIDSIVSLLIDHPLLGKTTDKEPYRIVIRGNYEIIYRIDHDTVYIVSLWDSRKNPNEKLLKIIFP
jgi:plasmid stabilization system protein ParE